MEPDAYEAMSPANLRGRKRRGGGFVAALSGGLTVIGAATIALIGVMMFRAGAPPADDRVEAAAPRSVGSQSNGNGSAAVAAIVQSPPASQASTQQASALQASALQASALESAQRLAAEKALAESLARRNAEAAAAAAAVPATPPPQASSPFAVTQSSPAQVAAVQPVQPPLASPPPQASPPAVPSVPPRPLAAPVGDTRALLARANSILKDGDVTGARLLLDRLVRAGDASAAFALAETYDPAVLNALNVRGIQPDPDKARALYKQALEGGVARAQARLSALGR